MSQLANGPVRRGRISYHCGCEDDDPVRKECRCGHSKSDHEVDDETEDGDLDKQDRDIRSDLGETECGRMEVSESLLFDENWSTREGLGNFTHSQQALVKKGEEEGKTSLLVTTTCPRSHTATLTCGAILVSTGHGGRCLSSSLSLLLPDGSPLLKLATLWLFLVNICTSILKKGHTTKKVRPPIRRSLRERARSLKTSTTSLFATPRSSLGRISHIQSPPPLVIDCCSTTCTDG